MSLKITNYAARAYGANTPSMPALIPRQKFNFFLSLVIDDKSFVFERVSDLTMPGYSFDTAIVNQYNKKRIVQTRMNYEPLQVSFYDTFDSSFHGIMKRYISHYYNDNTGIDDRRAPETNVLNDNINTSTMGYKTIPVDKRYFIPTVKVIQQGYSNGGDEDATVSNRETVLTNCIITDIKLDTLDYSSSEPVKFSVTFQPESITVIDQVNDAGG